MVGWRTGLLRRENLSIPLAEQSTAFASAHASRGHPSERDEFVVEGTVEQIQGSPDVLSWLGTTGRPASTAEDAHP